jgi:WD40 repeat protein
MNAPVNQPIAAAQGLSAVTPIALLKLENVYSSGTTIGVSSFIAYAMTRGRVRLIARSNGSRFLLHLPNSFTATTAATDMVVSGSYLACVTSDGGLVIWDVPDELDENPPVPVVLHVAQPVQQGSGGGAYALKLVKWHPHANEELVGGAEGRLASPGTIAVASDREVYVFNIAEAQDKFKGEEITLNDLAAISSVINVPSPLVGFSFDAADNAVVTISIDSTITCWDINERVSYWNGRVPGEGLPSSIDILPEIGVLVGRKQGTILQLLPTLSHIPSATVKLVYTIPTPPFGGKGKDNANHPPSPDEESIFAHVAYDPKLKTIWAAHSTRASLFAIRVGADASSNNAPTIEQIVDFPIPMQCINMAILTSSMSSSSGHPGHALESSEGNDAYDHQNLINLGSTGGDAASGGASGGPVGTAVGNMTAVAAFAMHSGGVDQINIAMNVFESAIANVQARLPSVTYGSSSSIALEAEKEREKSVTSGTSSGKKNSGSGTSASRGTPTAPAAPQATFTGAEPLRPRSPLSEPEADAAVTAVTPKKLRAGGPKPDNGALSSGSAPRPGNLKGNQAKALTEGAGGTSGKSAADGKETEASGSGVMAKDLRKVEDSLHSRIGKLLSKELDRQRELIANDIFLEKALSDISRL